MELCTSAGMPGLQASSGSLERRPAGQQAAAGMLAPSRSATFTMAGSLPSRLGCRSTSLSGPGQTSELSVSPLQDLSPTTGGSIYHCCCLRTVRLGVVSAEYLVSYTFHVTLTWLLPLKREGIELMQVSGLARPGTQECRCLQSRRTLL